MGQFMGCCGVEKFVLLQAATGNSRNYPLFSVYLFQVKYGVIMKSQEFRSHHPGLRNPKKLEEFHKYMEEKSLFVFLFILSAAVTMG